MTAIERPRYYPPRPAIHEGTGIPFSHRFWPDHEDQRPPRFFDLKPMLIQMRLYHYSRSVDFCNCWTSKSIQQLILWDQDPALHLPGKIIRHTVTYDPGKPKWLDGKPERVHRFFFREEFQYGLEWMICSWARTILHPSGKTNPNHAELEEFLDEIAIVGESSIQDILKMAADPDVKSKLMEREDQLRVAMERLPKQTFQFPVDPEMRKAFLKNKSKIEDSILDVSPAF